MHAMSKKQSRLASSITLGLLLCLSGCAGNGGLMNLGYVFPAGSSFTVDRANISVSMAGNGSATLEGVRCVGTNGFPLPQTNAVTVVPFDTRATNAVNH